MYSLLAISLLLLSSTQPQKPKEIPIYPGCPDNALCSKEAGLLRQNWKQLLMQNPKHPKGLSRLEAFRRTKGIPLDVWSPKGKKPPLGTHYDSPCSDSPWMLSEIFAPTLGRLPSMALPRRGYLLRGKDAIQAWLLPRGDVPLYEKQQRLYYNRNFEGEYYGISIGSGGDVRMEKVQKPLNPYDFPKTVACPQKLLDHFAKKNHSGRPDTRPQCLQLPSTGKAPLTLLLGQECG